MDHLLMAIGIPALAVVSFVAGWVISRRLDVAKIGSAETVAERMVEEAEREAETIQQKAELAARSNQLEQQEELSREADTRRSELVRAEARLDEREGKLDDRSDALSGRESELVAARKALDDREVGVDQKEEQVEALIGEQNVRLERVANMTAEEAREMLVVNMETEARSEGARRAKAIRDDATEQAQREALEVVGNAIQRYAGEHTTETTVSVVQLPNEEMKGRIIGREGRNIRAFEMASGVDVIVDDTPEAVILSGFDPIRREVARIAMQKLVDDGRIHPGRIEELVEKAQQQVEEESQRVGEESAFDLGVHDMHAQLVSTLGKLKYRTSYGQNVLQHSKEVGIVAGLMAEKLGLDAALARRAGLLHDIGKAVDRENEGTHIGLGVDLLTKYGESDDIRHAVSTHHDDVVSGSMMGVLVAAADTVSSARPGARRETIEAYVKRLQGLESIAQAFDGVEKTFAIQAGREVRVMVNCAKIDDAEGELLAGEIAQKVESDMEYPGQIKIVVIRESRATSFAK